MKKTIKIMLVEDHPEYRESIALALDQEAGLELVNQFGTAEQALRVLEKDPSICDLALLDLSLPGISGIEALTWFNDYAPKIQVIILTQSNHEADVIAAIAAGASGYLLKRTKPKELAEAIRNVMAGGASLDPRVAKFIINSLKSPNPDKTKDPGLSERELQTLKLLSQGLVKKEIAEELGVTPHTVATFTKRIYEKLQVPNAPAAVSKAHSQGLLPPQDD